MRILRLSWNKIYRLSKKLAIKVKGFRADILLGISRGGLVPVRLLSDFLDNPNIAIIKIEFYKGIGKTAKQPKIIQSTSANMRGKRVLIVDDIADTGKSLVLARNYLKQAGAKAIRIATLHYKKKSIIKPDYFIELTNDWICYPWEIEETKRNLKHLKNQKGVS